MAMLVRDRDLEKRIIADRRARGADRFDEVWDGVYVMSPIANDEHLRLREGRMESTGRSTVEGGEVLASEVLPLTFQLVVGDVGGRPQIEVRQPVGERVWRI